MTSMYQPPLNPFSGSYGPTGDYGPGKSPFFSLSNQFLPRNLHDIIRWSRYIITHSPLTTEVVRKLSTYPITEFSYETDNDGLRKRYDEIAKTLKLKSILHNIGFEHHTIGNVFVSIYFPIHRSLKCANCGTSHNAANAEWATFKTYKFWGACPACKNQGFFNVADSRSNDVSRMNIVTWDPTNIAVNHNPITGETDYYYKIPGEIKRRIQTGDRLFVDSIPWQMVEAVRNNQDFKFDRNAIYHLKNISTGQILNGIAVPPLVSHFSSVFYQSTLKKANETIATEFMAPLRVLYPQAQTGSGDPVVALSMRNFAANMTNAVKNHRRDQGYVLVAPVPVGYEAVSGEGKTLLISQEIQQAEETLLLSMGVSMELLSGSTNWTSSTVGLRLLENTMTCYTDQIEGLISWLFEQISKYLGLDTVPVSLTPFKLTDDDNLRQMLVNLAQANKVSQTTLYESLGLDYDEEMDRIRRDTVRQAEEQVKTQLEVERAQFLAARTASGGNDEQNDQYKDALTQAYQKVQELMGMDETTRRQVLNQLKIADYGMYLMVAKLLEEENQAARAAADQAMAATAAAGGDPSNPNDVAATQGAAGAGPQAQGPAGAATSNPASGVAPAGPAAGPTNNPLAQAM